MLFSSYTTTFKFLLYGIYQLPYEIILHFSRCILYITLFVTMAKSRYVQSGRCLWKKSMSALNFGLFVMQNCQAWITIKQNKY